MRSVRLAWMLRDLRRAPGRTLAMIAAVAVGAIAVGTTLGAYAVLSREIARSYRDTRPVSATLELERVRPEIVAAVRARPGIAAAERRATRLVRVEVEGGTRRMLLFVIDDFDALAVSTFTRASGSWPPAPGEILLERSSLRVLDLERGDVLRARAGGVVRELRFAGTVHDPGLAPAWMEMTAYGYVTPATLASLDAAAGLDELRVVFSDAGDAGVDRIDAEARALARWLEQDHGVRVHEIRVPPPRMHPHEGQMRTILVMLSAFGAITLVLGGVLVASVVAARMAAQTREIGVLKAIGGGTSQIAALSLATVGVVGAAAALVAIPIARLAAGAFAARLAGMLNFDVADPSIPAWVPLAQIVAAISIPQAIAALPIARAAAIPVRRAIDASEARAPAFGRRSLEAALTRVRGAAGWMLAVRNVFRRRAWLLTTLAQLSLGGATFVAAIGIGEGWRAWADDVEATRRYDVEVRVPDAGAAERAERALGALAGVRRIERWSFAPLASPADGGAPIERTYPDGGHGAFRALAAPEAVGLVDLPAIDGRSVDRLGPGEAVLDELAMRRAHARLGDAFVASIEGRPVAWRVVGVVRDIGSPASAYVGAETLARAAPDGTGALLRIAGDGSTDAQDIERALDAASVPLEDVVPREMLRTAVGDHVGILVAALVALALLIAAVGTIGLGTATATAVVERTRELGVLRAIGAPAGFVVRSLVTESVLVGAASGVLGVAASVLLSLALGGLLGRMAFGSPLPLVVPPLAIAGWLALVVVLAAISAAIPAVWATRGSVRDALT